jgi:hypothetical protein
MKTNVISVFIICATIIFVAFIFWPTLYRYDKITNDANSYLIRTHRITGYTEVFYNNIWIAQQNNIKIEKLPLNEQSKVTGNAGLNNYGSFSGKIYNGSSWSINEIVIRVCAMELDGSVRWERNYKKSVLIDPLSTSDIDIKVIDYGNVPKYEWNIIDIRGFMERD